MDKMSLLDIVQNILSSMDSDEVNSIDDTIESEQVALIVKQTYRALLSNRNWPHTKRLIQIEASGDDNIPTHMKLLDDVKQITFINYDTAPLSWGAKRNFEEIKWLEQDDFLRRLNHFGSTNNTMVVTDPSSLIPLTIRTDTAPTYYTSFDDTTIIFDSFDSNIDDTLQKSKTQVYGYIFPKWEHIDNFVPDLPIDAFTLLLEESKSRAFLELKQIANQKAEQEAQRQDAWLSRKDWRVKGGIKYPNYGRSPGRYKDSTFRREN